MPLHPDFENYSFQEPTSEEPRKWAGKYPSPEELEKGHEHLQATLSERNNQILELQQQLQQATQGYGLPDNRQSPVARSEQKARERLENLGIPPDAVMELADEVLQARLQPVVQSMEARRYITKNYPDYEAAEEDIVNFLGQNPEYLGEYQRVYQTSPRVAIEWAYQQFRKANPIQEQRQTLATDGHMPPNRPNRLANVMQISGDHESQEQQLWNDFRMTHNAQALLKHRLSGSRDRNHFQRGPYGT